MKKFLLCLLVTAGTLLAQAHRLHSPNGRLVVQVELSSKIYYSVKLDAVSLLRPSALSLELGDGTVLGAQPRLKEARQETHKGRIELPWGRQKVLDEVYNELELTFEGGFSVVFRAYDEGLAYRFRTRREGELIIRNEELLLNLGQAYQVWSTDYNTLSGSFEHLYQKRAFTDIKEGSYAYSPILLEHPAGPRVLLCDADLRDYPGLYFQRVGETARQELRGLFPKYPRSTRDGGWGHFNRQVITTEDYIAKTRGSRDFPWRAMLVADNDTEMLSNELVLKLGAPCVLKDTTWLQPGLAAWEWWNDWNLEGEDFRTGVNTATYERYIDFAAENRIPYLVVDEGWSDPYDLGLLNSELDLRAISAYAKKKGVKLILWCVWKTLVDQWDLGFKLFTDLGIAGIKVDFIDRDDQVAIASMEKIFVEAAARQLVVDFHGCRPLPGLARTYPNAFNFEGVRGGEYNKFSKEPPHPTYNAALPFTRGLVATMDYTPGAMRTVQAADYVASNSNTVVIGTRCHQLAMYVVYQAPLQMLCDSPSAYRKAPDFLSFLTGIPVTWEESRALESKVGEQVLVARRSGTTWYVGALAGAQARSVKLDLGFLGKGPYQATLVEDGVNADRLPTDYRLRQFKVEAGTGCTLNLAAGGGAVLKLEAR